MNPFNTYGNPYTYAQANQFCSDGYMTPYMPMGHQPPTYMPMGHQPPTYMPMGHQPPSYMPLGYQTPFISQASFMPQAAAYYPAHHLPTYPQHQHPAWPAQHPMVPVHPTHQQQQTWPAQQPTYQTWPAHTTTTARPVPQNSVAHRGEAEVEVTNRFTCPNCDKTFTRRNDRDRHIRHKHNTTRHTCAVCGRHFSRPDILQRHVRAAHTTTSHQLPPSSAQQPVTIPTVQQTTSTSRPDQSAADQPPTRPDQQATSTSADQPPATSTDQPPATSADQQPSTSADHSTSTKRKQTVETGQTKRQRLLSDLDEIIDLPSDVRDIYLEHWQAIHTHSNIHEHLSTHTFFHSPRTHHPIRWENTLFNIFQTQTKRFKINLSHHIILRHKETNELRFFHASSNNATVLEFPHLVNNRADMQEFIEIVNNTDIFDIAMLNRPDTKYSVESIAATSFYIYHIQEFPIGCTMIELPDYIVNNKAIHIIKTDSSSKTYSDNLCFFRCLAIHQGTDVKDNRRHTKVLAEQWREYRGLKTLVNFPGVDLLEVAELERCFSINLEIYEFKNGVLSPKIRSVGGFSDSMYLLLFKSHFMYIRDISEATSSFSCSKCGKLWKMFCDLDRHEKKCSGDRTRDVYKGGIYHTPLTIWERLKDDGFGDVTSFVYPYRATFDFECYFEDIPTSNGGGATQLLAKHLPLSCSVASNIPGMRGPFCFVSEGDPQALVDSMLDCLHGIADEAYRLLSLEFDETLTSLREMGERKEYLYDMLVDYLKQLPVIGFNSGKYDINLIRPYLVQHFIRLKEKEKEVEAGEELDGVGPTEVSIDGDENRMMNVEGCKKKRGKKSGDGEDEEPFKFIVKRNSNFMCITTARLKFLDIINYLAPGFSYSKYLAAYNVRETKGFFCYEYVRSIKVLEETQLPPHSAFYSALKKTNISEEEYALCQGVWKKEGMTTLRDFLIWYNNKDVVPFLEALDQQVRFYECKGVDMFKDAISVPGVTLKYLFKSIPKGIPFSLCSKKEEDLHRAIRRNIVGGPSVIFHRYHEQDKTFIRGNKEKVVKCIKGYDANALYLYALMQDMPAGYPVIRDSDIGFRPSLWRRYGIQCREWLAWVSHCTEVRLKSEFNGGEQSLGPRYIRVDGWDSRKQVAYQFHGCLFHGHPNCPLTHGREFNPYNNKPLTELYANTVDITTYLRQEVGVTVVEMWECQWKNLKKTTPPIRQFLSKFPVFKHQHPSYKGKEPLTEQQILESVMDNSCFGLIECDIKVPDHLKDKFSEMTPIFKNIDVSCDDIGPFMSEYARERKLLTTPRRTLIGSYVGNKILLATPLLKWYLEHGLEVTKIYRVIEYTPVDCFKKFGDEVSDARRRGDIDDSKSIISDTMKLLGNSAYGKTLTNKAKHTDVFFCNGTQMGNLVKNKTFKSSTRLGEGDLYEVVMAKNEVIWDLPLQIGFFVYQYAKLRMLAFYYDFLDKFVDRSDFQLCEMDTDSLYLALSANELSHVVRTDKLDEFYREYMDWFPTDVCDRHKDDFVNGRGSVTIDCQACRARGLYDKRTPGLFKLEYGGSGIVSLCSKTYHCFGEYNKTSTKGLTKQHNKLEKTHFMNVLETRLAGGGRNIGFKTQGDSIYTYTQHRNSLSYLYIKRKVEADNVTTTPLDI